MKRSLCHFVLVGVLVFLGACSADDTDAGADRGRRVATAVMGINPDAPLSANVRMARYQTVASYIVAEIDRHEPDYFGSLGREIDSKDADRMQRALVVLDAKLTDTAASRVLTARISQDPLFTDGSGTVRVKSEGAGGGGGGGGSTGGSGQTPDVGKGADGKYGDDRTGPMGAAKDLSDLNTALGPLSRGGREQTLADIDAGKTTPNPDSRLGAYDATKGYPPGSVGDSVHNAIGEIYKDLGDYGQENIGRVFNSDEAKALYGDPVDSDSGRKMAEIEHQYWQNVKSEDPWSMGGQLGSAFNPAARDWLQRNWFSRR
jgi:hypothetical protein